jgi:YD repeat-containing protein
MKTNAFVGFPRVLLNWPSHPFMRGLVLCACGALMCARAASPQLAIELLPGGEAALRVSGDTNRFEVIEISSNLTGWTPLVTLLNSNGVVNYVDATATNSSVRFYRAQQRITTNAPSFNTALLFNLTMEDAANPSCGCGSEAAYNQGISQVSRGCPECESAPPITGMAQDTGIGHVFLHNGEFVHRAVDLEISSRGFNWRLARVYRSGITFDGPLGHNWDFSHNRRLLVETNGHVLRMDGDGRADLYLSVDGTNYQSPRGFYTKLIRQLGGSFVERDRHGTKVLYAAPNERGIAVMTEVRDRHTNAMHFEYNSAAQLVRVRDTFGRAIDYRYSLAGRLSEVEDFTGRIVAYQYDSLGNLISVTSPAVTGTPNGNDFPAGKTTRYQYSSGFADERLNHNLVSITAPNEAAVSGPARVRAEYETNATADLDRLVRLHLGGTNASAVPAGGTLAYAYQNLGAAASNDFLTAVFETAVTDRNGNLAEYQFNQLGNAVRVREFSNRNVRASDPAFFETRYEYNGEGEMTRLVRPEGNSIEFSYDLASSDRFQQGNLLLTRRVPDATRGGDQTSIAKSFTYEPLFNQVRTITHSRGNDASYIPQNGGAQSAARYTATFSYDYQENASAPGESAAFGIAIPPALLGLGDLNGDGQTNQNGGTLVRRNDPTVTLLAGSNQALAEGDTSQEIVTRYGYNQFGQIKQIENARGNITTFAYYPANDPDGDGLNLIAGADPAMGGYLAQTVRDGVLGPRRQDAAGLVAITNRFVVDARGNITALTDGRGLTRRTTYNALNQVVQYEAPPVDGGQPTGYLQRYFYDANNNRVGTDVQNVTTDASTHLPVIVAAHPWFEHRTTFDILNRAVESVSDATRDAVLPPSPQPQSLTNRFRYDANQNLIRRISPLAANGDANNDERMTYDERDLRFTITRGGVSADASTRTHDYDLNGNLARLTDAEDNDGVPGNEFETTTYDGFDRVRATVDRGGNERRQRRWRGGYECFVAAHVFALR